MVPTISYRADLVLEPLDFRWSATVGTTAVTAAHAVGTCSRVGASIDGLDLGGSEPGGVLRALVDELTRQGLAPITYCAPTDGEIDQDTLGRLGFIRLADWVTVRAELRSQRALVTVPFELEPLLCRPSDGLPILAETVGRLPGYEGLEIDAVLEDLVAGSRHPSLDPLGWLIAYHGSRACGVVLPEHGSVGMLSAFAIARWAQGRGWGRLLHRYAMELLAMHGAYEYVDHTPAANEAMRRVFRRNGCEEVGTFQQWSYPAAGLERRRAG